MLNLKKTVLVGKYLPGEFEAIERITSASQIPEIWAKNKTPFFCCRKLKLSDEFNPYSQKIVFLPVEISDASSFIRFCHKNGFECGEIVTHQKFDTTNEDCFLCQIGNHKESTVLYNMHCRNIYDMIIYESDHFYVIPELGALLPGMVMIVPMTHIYSAACISDNIFSEYLAVEKDIELILKKTYGDKPVIFFEHGSCPSGFSSHAKSIVHAHTHIAILDEEFDHNFLKDVGCRIVTDIRECSEVKYFSYQSGTKGKIFVADNPDIYVQRQYPRQVIAYMYGIPFEDSNWRTEHFDGNISKTLSDIYLSLNTYEFSDKIKNRTHCFTASFPMRIEN